MTRHPSPSPCLTSLLASQTSTQAASLAFSREFLGFITQWDFLPAPMKPHLTVFDRLEIKVQNSDSCGSSRSRHHSMENLTKCTSTITMFPANGGEKITLVSLRVKPLSKSLGSVLLIVSRIILHQTLSNVTIVQINVLAALKKADLHYDILT